MIEQKEPCINCKK